MKQWKRVISMLLMWCMMAAMLPATVFAAEIVASGFCGNDLNWKLDGDGILTISGTGEMRNYDYMDYTAPWKNKEIVKVVIETGVTSIGAYSFYGCTFQEISIPSTITSINEGAFFYCHGFEHITLPEGVKSISSRSFVSCGIKSISIPNSITYIPAQAFHECNSLTDVYYAGNEGDLSIDSSYNNPFVNASIHYNSLGPDFDGYCGDNLTWKYSDGSLTISGTGDMSNYYYTDIDPIPAPWSKYQESIVNVIVEKGVTSIGSDAFTGCTSLANITVPDSITNIKFDAFSDCNSLTDVYYAGSKERWDNISIGNNNTPLTKATIHYNSTGPDDVGSGDDVSTAAGSVQFLSGWDEESRNVSFNSNQVSPNHVAESVDTSGISNMVGKYVLVTTNPDSPLEVTSIQPVESKIGTCSAVNGQTMTIDGVSYPVPDSWVGVDMYAGKDILYHISEGEVVGADTLLDKSGILEDWDGTTGQATIGGTVYPTNYLSDLSFSNNINEYLQKGINFITIASSNYHPLLKVTGSYYPGGKLEDFNKDIYHATWLSKGGNDADILSNQTPSKILIKQIDEANSDLAIDLWRSFEVVFETLDDVTTLYDFAVEPKDVYSALILNALEGSASNEVIASEFKDGVKLSKALISDLSAMLKANFGIDINNNDELQEFVSQLDGSAEQNIKDFTDDWFKINYPELKFYKEYFKWISSGIKAVGTTEDLANYCSQCYALRQISDSMKAVLEQGLQKSKDTYGASSNITRAFEDCLDMITRSSDEMFDQVEKRAIFVVGEQGAKYIIGDLLWSKFTDYIKTACPEVAILQLGYKVGKTVSNWLCNTDDAVEQYLKMDYITDIEFLIDLVYRDMELEFDKNSTVENAIAYLSAMELSFQLRDVDCETASKYVDVLIDALVNKVDIFNGALINSDSLWNGALLNKIGQAFGKKDYSELKKSIEAIRSNYATAYVGAATNWINYLDEDYPGAGLEKQYEHFFDDVRNAILKKEYKAACPVDVYVYDNTNNVVAFISDGKISCNVNDIVVALLGDTKVVRFYNDTDYRIEYVGNDLGDMDISIIEYDTSEKAIRTVNYYDIPLSSGKTYSVDAGSDTLKPYELEDKTDNSIVDFDYDSMVTSTPHTIKAISGTLLQNGEIYVETVAKKGEALQLDAYVPYGYEFIRWESSSEATKILDSNSKNTTVIMADEDIIVTAVMKETQSKPTTHTIFFAPNGGAVDVASMATEANGKLSSLPTPTRSDYTFDGWFTSANGGSKITTDTIFTANSTVYAHWTYIGGSSSGGSGSSSGGGGGGSSSSSNTITVPNTPGGKVSISPSKASAGTKVTISTIPDPGYELEKITVTDNRGNEIEPTVAGSGKHTFTMPNSKVTITATFKREANVWNNPFTDVAEGGWYYNAVKFVSESSLMSGYGNGIFAPNANLTRAMLVQILYNKAGKPDVTYDGIFTDVASDTWYANAVIWAEGNGIVSGYGNNLFGPNDNITREQLAVILWRYAGSPAATNKELKFTDSNEVSRYAVDALKWAVENGIISGYGNGILAPKGFATRAQTAQMLKNYFEK